MSRSESTSIRIGRETLERLNDRKDGGETHDDLVNRMMDEIEDEQPDE